MFFIRGFRFSQGVFTFWLFCFNFKDVLIIRIFLLGNPRYLNIGDFCYFWEMAFLTTTLILTLLFSILNLLKLTTMGQNLKEIQSALADANAKVDKVAADVQRLHDLINNTSETPSQEEWDAVKKTVAELNDKLQKVDDETPE